MVPETFLAGVFSCVWCCSIWMALAWFLFWLFFPKIAEIGAIPFALSAGAILVNELIGKNAII